MHEKIKFYLIKAFWRRYCKVNRPLQNFLFAMFVLCDQNKQKNRWTSEQISRQDFTESRVSIWKFQISTLNNKNLGLGKLAFNFW